MATPDYIGYQEERLSRLQAKRHSLTKYQKQKLSTLQPNPQAMEFSILADIPTEIQLNIWDKYFQVVEIQIGSREDREFWDKRPRIYVPALLFVCKKIYIDAIGEYKTGPHTFTTTFNVANVYERHMTEPLVIKAFRLAMRKFETSATDGSILKLNIINLNRSTLKSIAVIPLLIREFDFPEVDGVETLQFVVHDDPVGSFWYNKFDPGKVEQALQDLREYSKKFMDTWRQERAFHPSGLTNIDLAKRTLRWFRSPPSTTFDGLVGKKAIMATWALYEDNMHKFSFQMIQALQDAGLKCGPVEGDPEFVIRTWF